MCEEPADQLCVQCGDLYCSNNTSNCFGTMHSRGNRATHTLQALVDEEKEAVKAASVLKLPGIGSGSRGGGQVVSSQKMKQKRL